MRIITEENVDQLLNLSYQSKNISKLLNISDTDFKDINALTTQYRKQLEMKVMKMNDTNLLGNIANAALLGNIQEVDPQEFDSIDSVNNVNVNPPHHSSDEFITSWYSPNESELELARIDQAKLESDFARDINNPEQMNEYIQSDKGLDPNLDMSMPNFSDPTLKSWWPVLVISEQQHILSFPKNKQEDEMKNTVKNRMRYLQTGMPNYGPDGELNMLFAKLSAPEQIQLLRLSYETQIEKLKKMARDNLEPNNFNNLRIIIPENKTSSEQLYGSPELQMLAPAPANTPVTEDKPSDDKKDVSGGSSSTNSNIKKIIF